jgi:hypothetical protein
VISFIDLFLLTKIRLSELNGVVGASDQESVAAMFAFTSVYFGDENLNTPSSFFTCSILLKNLFDLAEDLLTRFQLHASCFQNCHASFSG